MNQISQYSLENLALDKKMEIGQIVDYIRKTVSRDLGRRGVVLGLSGGIDSSTVAGLCVEALGSDRVFGLLMPERHSSDDTLEISQSVADTFGIQTLHQDISESLDAVQCYERQNEVFKQVFPDFTEEWKVKIVLPKDLSQLRVFSAVALTPDGELLRARLKHEQSLAIVAATNFKQRIRKMYEYYHADRLHFAVAGTPNYLEYDQGFFVKLGDGSADLKPIAHLYKTQVFALAAELGVPDVVLNRTPTTDTYSLEQTQDEFYFSLPYKQMDLAMFGFNHNIPKDLVAEACEISVEKLEYVYRDIEQKRRTTRYLHLSPILKNPDLKVE